jgi:hypothetical protein
MHRHRNVTETHTITARLLEIGMLRYVYGEHSTTLNTGRKVIKNRNGTMCMLCVHAPDSNFICDRDVIATEMKARLFEKEMLQCATQKMAANLLEEGLLQCACAATDSNLT